MHNDPVLFCTVGMGCPQEAIDALLKCAFERGECDPPQAEHWTDFSGVQYVTFTHHGQRTAVLRRDFNRHEKMHKEQYEDGE